MVPSPTFRLTIRLIGSLLFFATLVALALEPLGSSQTGAGAQTGQTPSQELSRPLERAVAP